MKIQRANFDPWWKYANTDTNNVIDWSVLQVEPDGEFQP